LETTSNRGADEGFFLNFDAGRTTSAVLDVEPAKRGWRVRDLRASRRFVRIGASERGARDFVWARQDPGPVSNHFEKILSIPAVDTSPKKPNLTVD
jgi:hypothetical protein